MIIDIIKMRIKINDYIVADTDICHGTPTFKGTRVMVWLVLEMLRDGVPIEEITKNFIVPLKKENIKAALDYASMITKGSDNVVVSVGEQS